MTSPSRQLAKDVASELERRRRRRKVIFFLVWAALIIAALLWLRCGRGWGTGGNDPGKGPGTGAGSAQPLTTPGAKRCTVRVSAEGIAVDGRLLPRDEAVAACKQTEGALITVTGDARQGDWDDLRTALEAAGVPIFKRGN